VINREVKMWKSSRNAVKWSEVKRSEVKGSKLVRKWGLLTCSEVEWREGHGEMRVQRFMTIHTSLLLLCMLIVIFVNCIAFYSLCIVCPLLFV
jgi:hypothetical protein